MDEILVVPTTNVVKSYYFWNFGAYALSSEMQVDEDITFTKAL